MAHNNASQVSGEEVVTSLPETTQVQPGVVARTDGRWSYCTQTRHHDDCLFHFSISERTRRAYDPEQARQVIAHHMAPCVPDGLAVTVLPPEWESLPITVRIAELHADWREDIILGKLAKALPEVLKGLDALLDKWR